MLFTKFYTDILKTNGAYNYKLLSLLFGIVLMLTIGNGVVADVEARTVKDIKSELAGLTINECASISKANRDGYFVVTLGTRCETIYQPVELKADEVSDYVKSCLEGFALITVMKADNDGNFYVFDSGNNVSDVPYDGLSGGMYRYGYDMYPFWGMGGLFGLYGIMPGIPPGLYGGMYGYGYGMNPFGGMGGLSGLYGIMPGISTGLYSRVGGYGNFSYSDNGSAQSFQSPFSNGYPILTGYPDLMLGNFLITLLLGNIPLNNRPTAIPSGNNLVRDLEVLRRAHGYGSINPVFSGPNLTPGLPILNFAPGYPVSPFQIVPGQLY